MRWLRAIRSFLRDYGDALSLTALAAALFAVATNTQTGWLYLFCAFLLAALAFHRLLGTSELRGLELELAASPFRARAGEEGEWVWRARAPRAKFRYPLIMEVCPQAFEPPATTSRFFAWTRAEQEFRVSTLLQRRGLIAGLEVRVHSWAPFAWFSTRREFLLTVAPEEIVVLPSGPVLSLDMAPSSAAREGSASTSLRAGQWGDLRRLRDYASGDDPRWVHWASTARLGRLVVREHSQQSSQSLTVLVDCASGPYDQFERLISWAAALVDWAPRRGYEVQLGLNGAALPESYVMQNDPLEALARIPLGGVALPSAVTVPHLQAMRGGLVFWLTMGGQQPVPQGLVVLDFSDQSIFAVGADVQPQAFFREALGRKKSRTP